MDWRNKEDISRYQKAYRSAHREELKKYHKERYLSKRKEINLKQKDWYKRNRKKVISYVKDWQSRNIEKSRSYKKKWRDNNKDKERERRNKKYHEDPGYRAAYLLRRRVYKAIRGEQKSGSAVRDLGCTIEKLIKHLEKRFLPGMSWDKRGEWHIDHIIPLSSFDLTDRKQFLKACHYTNLQPLWAKDNLKKGPR